MNWRRAVLAILIVSAAFQVNLAANAETDIDAIKEMQQQIRQLQSRLAEVEQRNQDLETRLSRHGQRIQETRDTQISQSEKKVKEEKPAVRSQYPVELYGYLKFTSAYDTARINDGNFARWVESDANSPNDDQFNATAKQSRLGLRFSGPEMGSTKSGGRVEIDFRGGGAENHSLIRMRHAYAELMWPDSDMSLLAGQTSDIISPLFPSVINQFVDWYAGNIGTRRPQVRLTKGFDLGGDSSLLFQGGFSRTIGDDMFAFDPGDTGEDAGFPTAQARLAYSFPLLTDRPTTFGVSGHYGQEEIDLDVFDHSRDMDTWSLNLDWIFPVIDKVTLKGEAFIGENLDTYAGGIGQGIVAVDRDGDPSNGKEYPQEGINTKGGWAAFELGPWNRLHYTLGASIEDTDDGDLNKGMRSQNASVFGTAYWEINKAITTAFEVSYWDTKYANQADGESLRIQAALYYKF